MSWRGDRAARSMSTWLSTSTPVIEPVSLSMKAAVLRSATPDLCRSLARRVSLRSLVGLAAMLTVATVQAAAFKASVISRDDDPRLERSRTERAYLGHPGGPVVDAVQVAIKEAKFELDAAGASVVVDQLAVASLDAERAKFGADAVSMVLAREAEVTATWDALLDGKGERR